MSGNNNNAYAESKRMILGVGDLYVDDVFVGNLKGSVTLKVAREYAYQRAGNNIADQKGEVTNEEATIEAEVCDLKVAQLRIALGVVQAVDISTAKIIRKREVILVTAAGGAGTVLGETPLDTAASLIKVSSLDRKTSYITGTDYKVSGSTNFESVSGGALASGGMYVAVEYDFSDAGAQSLAMGGETKPPPTFRMDYVIRDSAGKAWQITFFKAMTTTDFEMAFNDRESGDFTVYNVMFKALVDTTRPEGANMMEIVQEDAAT